jgi:hypothetical protein
MIDQKCIDAFHSMWGSFPAPVRLIHKSKEVVAVNEVAESRGMEVGIPCFSSGIPESHKACKATEALSSKQGQRMNVESKKIKFWIPVRNYPDVYVHFTIPIDSIL